MCAIKEVRVVSDDKTSKESLKQLNQEITFLSQLSHPNIVQYYESELDIKGANILVDPNGEIKLADFGMAKHDIKSVLRKFGSNIIFSNGLRDPYSSGGVLEDLSDSLLAVSTISGSHCLDLKMAKPSDPQWLTMQRKMEVQIIDGWIKNYYAHLPTSKH